jgi:MerR family transcriptional regulator, light-induced transcriptional regulator
MTMQLREAADALGVHYQTAYGWVRDGALPARKRGRGYEISAADVALLAQRREQGAEPVRKIQVRDWGPIAGRLTAALLAGQERRAQAELDRLAGAIPVLELCDQLLAPALREIGAAWASNTASIAQEHRATAICERLLTRHLRRPAGRPRATAVVATPAGERHGFPSLMAAACLAEDHWRVHHLAADLPAAEVAGLAADVGASLTVLSTTMADAAATALAEYQPIDPAGAAGRWAGGPHGCRVLIGRPGDTLHDLISQARAG